MNFLESLCQKACYCMTVSGLRDILDDLCEDGYENAYIAFRLGHYDDGIKAVCLPIADIRVGNDKDRVILTPAARTKEVNGVSQPDFDLCVSFRDNDLSVTMEEVIFEREGEENVQ